MKQKTERVIKTTGRPPTVAGAPAAVRPEPTATWETVTPAMAEEWLSTEVANRALRNALFERYARDMATARWLLTGDAIRFDWDGHLIDGQHRLWSAVEAQASFRTLVIRGLDPAIFIVLDSGSKRTVGDALHIEKNGDSSRRGAVAGYLCRFRIGGESAALNHGRAKPTTSEIIATYHRYAEDIAESLRRAKASKEHPQLLPHSLGAFLHLVFAERNREMANGFFDGLTTGESKRGTPVHLLVQKLIEWRRRRVNLPRLLGDATIRAWNATREGRPLGKLPLLPRFDPKTGMPKIL